MLCQNKKNIDNNNNNMHYMHYMHYMHNMHLGLFATVFIRFRPVFNVLNRFQPFDISAIICNRWDIQCLPYAGFLLIFNRIYLQYQ